MNKIDVFCTIDRLGRLYIPKYARRKMRISKQDKIEMYVEEQTLQLKPYKPQCLITGECSDENIVLSSGTITLSTKAAKHVVAQIHAYLEK
ncbi:AbrB/MazE/SpoVT family DNA-binding domain-containing protein [Bacillus mycoides]|uniref:AbrB/MazE/SpoVT family DNA-binding domain-containing protein n=1 Tax=Bacillus mycoides TaxID=1405 RepID=UPI000BFB759F|nr:AbrB/MazE/SpoVT family DNA-binding domain-containing protein [Bacillus mycoides]MCQ6530804.1 AbrB/MazE/SpoVT family DNA-binding domain-containing protein [Bacillus mycoides]PGT74216.1 AbrB family transcriptional regulator [Bacillus cereus]PGV88991.1 AbrB family transcriptional regulator [Bacillus cereus]